MKNATLFLLVFLLAGFSCKPKQTVKDNYVFFAGMPTRSEEELARLVFEKGDEIAYRELRGGYYFGSYKFLEYALYTANKYDFMEAYCDVYFCLAWIHNDHSDNGMYYNLDRLDETTRQIALDYLKKAHERGDPEASRYLGEYYIEGKYFKKDTVLGRELINKLFGKPRNIENDMD